MATQQTFGVTNAWELLTYSSQSEASTELTPTDSPAPQPNQSLATLSLSASITPESIPNRYDWLMTETVASAEALSQTVTIVTTDPTALTLLNQHRPARLSDQETGTVIVSGYIGGGLTGAAIGANKAFTDSGGRFSNALLGGLFGAVAGYGAFLAAAHRLDTRGQRSDKKLVDCLLQSQSTYVFPNTGMATENLGVDVARVLKQISNPDEHLHSNLGHLVRSVMESEVELQLMAEKLTNIAERGSALGVGNVAIELDKTNAIELEQAKQHLLAQTAAHRAEIKQIPQVEQNWVAFQAAVLGISAKQLPDSPELHEFSSAVQWALGEAYDLTNASQMIAVAKAMSGLVAAIDSPDLLEPAYQAFKQSWSDKGITLLSYEALQDFSMQNRDLR